MNKGFLLILILIFSLGCRKCPQSEVVPPEWKDSNFTTVSADKFPHIKRTISATWRCPQPDILLIPNTVSAIAGLLSNDRKVSLYIKGEKSKAGDFLASRWASVYFQFFGSNGNFSIVERTQLDDVLREHKINMTGIVAPDEDKRTLRFAGVTHILFVGCAGGGGRLFGGNDLSGRLVDVETGKVLSIDVIMD